MQSENGDSNTKFHVLCIDDNQDFLQVLSHLIDALGYDLTTAFSAVRGLDMVRTIQPNIIFCDLGLPDGVDGFEFARRIRSDQTLNVIPMVAMSARADDESRVKALESGFNKILLKPVKFADIRTILLEAENYAS